MPRSGTINPVNALSTNVVNIQSIKRSSRGKNAPKINPSININPPLLVSEFKHKNNLLNVEYIAINKNSAPFITGIDFLGKKLII
jgi:hypothetical protein